RPAVWICGHRRKQAPAKDDHGRGTDNRGGREGATHQTRPCLGRSRRWVGCPVRHCRAEPWRCTDRCHSNTVMECTTSTYVNARGSTVGRTTGGRCFRVSQGTVRKTSSNRAIPEPRGWIRKCVPF